VKKPHYVTTRSTKGTKGSRTGGTRGVSGSFDYEKSATSHRLRRVVSGWRIRARFSCCIFCNYWNLHKA